MYGMDEGGMIGDTGCWILDTGCWILGNRPLLLETKGEKVWGWDQLGDFERFFVIG